jgi:hypothetical protein
MALAKAPFTWPNSSLSSNDSLREAQFTFIIHFAMVLEMPLLTYSIYAIHMMIAVPMLVLDVSFAKWAHLLYRPFTLYLMRVKERALA